jgi:hypothetical protein
MEPHDVYFVYDGEWYLPTDRTLLRYIGDDQPHTKDIVKCRIQVHKNHIGIDYINVDQLEQWCNALSKWQDSSLSHYTYEIQWVRYRISNKYISVHVADGTNVQHSGTQLDDTEDTYGTIEDLFAHIFDWVTLEYHTLSIIYDEVVGYPQFGVFDRDQKIADGEVSFNIRTFHVHNSNLPDGGMKDTSSSSSSSSTVIIVIIVFILVFLLYMSILWLRGTTS